MGGELDKARALIDHLTRWALGEDPVAHFEAGADTFRRATGMMAPGKSEPMEMGGSEERDTGRRAAWTEWCRIRHKTKNEGVLALLAEVDRLTAALEEAEATIANEHGDGPVPTEGWQWITTSSMQGMWRRKAEDNDQMVQRLVGRGWYWTDWAHPFHPNNVHTTARAAMRAALTATEKP